MHRLLVLCFAVVFENSAALCVDFFRTILNSRCHCYSYIMLHTVTIC